MKILFADDFYSNFELYETKEPDELKSIIKRLANGEDAEIDKKRRLIGSSNDNLLTDIAIRKADEIVWTSDLIED